MTLDQMNRSAQAGPRTKVSMYEACLLHSRTDRALRMVVSRRLEQYDITMMEWLLLGTVKNGPEDGLTMSAVAATLDVTLPQVTALSASLTKAKLLKQKVSRQDRRSRRLLITPAGQKLLDEVGDATSEALDEWLADVPAEQLATYLDTLKLLADHTYKQ